MDAPTRIEFAHYFRSWRWLLYLGLAAILETTFQVLNHFINPFIGVPPRSMRVVGMLLQALPWFAVWVSRDAILREYATRRAEDLQLTRFSHWRLFLVKFLPLVPLIAACSFLAHVVSGIVYEYLFPSPFTSSPGGFSLRYIILWGLALNSWFWVFVPLCCPLVAFAMMIRFPQSARTLGGFVLAGVIAIGICSVIWVGGWQSFIWLKNRFYLWPPPGFSFGIFWDIQIWLLLLQIPLIAALGIYVIPRFRRLLELPNPSKRN